MHKDLEISIISKKNLETFMRTSVAAGGRALQLDLLFLHRFCRSGRDGRSSHWNSRSVNLVKLTFKSGLLLFCSRGGHFRDLGFHCSNCSGHRTFHGFEGVRVPANRI